MRFHPDFFAIKLYPSDRVSLLAALAAICGSTIQPVIDYQAMPGINFLRSITPPFEQS